LTLTITSVLLAVLLALLWSRLREDGAAVLPRASDVHPCRVPLRRRARAADKKAFRAAYIGIPPAMEGALKCLWVMGKAKRKSLPQRIDQLIAGVEEVFPEFQKIFSVQTKRKDSLGNDVYRKVNGWAHASEGEKKLLLRKRIS
jgi:hypothetical protein